jgi:hypothetical protein
MPTMIQSLGLDRLSVGERLELAEELWDSVADSSEVVSLKENGPAERTTAQRGRHSQNAVARDERHPTLLLMTVNGRSKSFLSKVALVVRRKAVLGGMPGQGC